MMKLQGFLFAWAFLGGLQAARAETVLTVDAVARVVDDALESPMMGTTGSSSTNSTVVPSNTSVVVNVGATTREGNDERRPAPATSSCSSSKATPRQASDYLGPRVRRIAMRAMKLGLFEWAEYEQTMVLLVQKSTQGDDLLVDFLETQFDNVEEGIGELQTLKREFHDLLGASPECTRDEVGFRCSHIWDS